MKFSFLFSSCFFVGSLAVIAVDGSAELFTGILFFNIFYFIISLFTWPIINLIPPSAKVFIALRCLIGLIVLNMIVYPFEQRVLSFSLFKEHAESFSINLAMHTLYFVSFAVAQRKQSYLKKEKALLN